MRARLDHDRKAWQTNDVLMAIERLAWKELEGLEQIDLVPMLQSTPAQWFPNPAHWWDDKRTTPVAIMDTSVQIIMNYLCGDDVGKARG